MDQNIYEGLQNYVNQLNEDVMTFGDENVGKAHARYMQALDMLKQFDHEKMDFKDKEERRRIESEKNADAKEVELKKQDLNWKRVCFELAKVGIPVVASIGTFYAGLSMAYDVEKEGRISSKFSNMVLSQLPRIWKG